MACMSNELSSSLAMVSVLIHYGIHVYLMYLMIW